MIGSIGASDEASLRLREAGRLRRVGWSPSPGFEFGRRIDAVMLQRRLGAGGNELPSAWPADKADATSS